MEAFVGIQFVGLLFVFLERLLVCLFNSFCILGVEEMLVFFIAYLSSVRLRVL